MKTVFLKVCMNRFWFNRYALIEECYEEEIHLETLSIDGINHIDEGLLIRLVNAPAGGALKILHDWFKHLCERLSKDGKAKSSVIEDCQDAHTIQSSQVCQKSDQDFEVDIWVGFDD
jgi:hypothetical protein